MDSNYYVPSIPPLFKQEPLLHFLCSRFTIMYGMCIAQTACRFSLQAFATQEAMSGE